MAESRFKLDSDQELTFTDLNFHLEKGEILAVYGKDQGAKAVFIELLAGLLPPPNDGQVIIAGNDLYNDLENLYGIIGLVPRTFAEKDILTGQEYLDYYASLCMLKRSKRDEVIGKIVELFAITDLLAKFIDTMTLPELKRISMARSLIADPQLLILDEVFIEGDQIHNEFIFSVIRKINLAGKTLVISSANIQNLLQICNKFCLVEIDKIDFLADRASVMNKLQDNFIDIIRFETNNYNDKITDLLLKSKNIFGITVTVSYIEFEFKGDSDDLKIILGLLDENCISLKKFTKTKIWRDG